MPSLFAAAAGPGSGSSRRRKDASADAGGAVVLVGGSIQHSSRQATAMRPKQKDREKEQAERRSLVSATN